jgi:hypothetical protein
MAKKPQLPTAAKRSPVQIARLREIAGSGALIAAFQAAIPTEYILTKAILSCVAPLVIEVFFYLFDTIARWIIDTIRRKHQKNKLSQAEKWLAIAMASTLTDRDKKELQAVHAQTIKRLTEGYFMEVIAEDNRSYSSEVSHGSATG